MLLRDTKGNMTEFMCPTCLTGTWLMWHWDSGEAWILDVNEALSDTKIRLRCTRCGHADDEAFFAVYAEGRE